MPVDLVQLQDTNRDLLVAQARSLGVPEPDTLRRSEIVFSIAQAVGHEDGVTLGRGVLEVHSEGFGFLRSPQANFVPGADDIYVSQSQIRRFKLKTGDTVIGHVRAPKEGERYLALLRVEMVNGDRPGVDAPSFERLTAIYPDEPLTLGSDPMLAPIQRFAPLGLGQRAMLIAPSRTGRVELLRRLVRVLGQDEDLDVTVLLVDDRPEEIAEWRQDVRAEVIATPFDEPPGRHVQVADIVFERARRMVERGDDVVIVVNNLSRLLRACVAEQPSAGREIGGVDAGALHRVRRYMGAARALAEGGSLTVIGVVSGDPHSGMDAALIDDLHDVVNWEVALSRDLAAQGIVPPVDVGRSATLRIERLLNAPDLASYQRWRAQLTGDPAEDARALLTWSAPSLSTAAVGSTSAVHTPAVDSAARSGQ